MRSSLVVAACVSIVASSLTLAACVSSDPSPSPNAPFDAGLAFPDTGNPNLPPQLDSSIPASDAGVDAPIDSAIPPPADAGSPPDASGTITYARGYLSSSVSFSGGVVDPQGNHYVIGETVGASDAGFGPDAGSGGVYYAKLDPSGGVFFVDTLGSSQVGVAGQLGSAAVARDPVSGAVYVAAGLKGTATFGGVQYTTNGWDVLVLRFDDAGNVVAGKQLGGAADEQVIAMAVAGGRVAMTGDYMKGAADFGTGALPLVGTVDAWVAELDAATLAPVFARSYGDAGDQGSEGLAIALDDAANLYAAGWFCGKTDFGGGPVTAQGPSDGYVVSLDASGAHRWSKILGAAGQDQAAAVAFDANGNVVASGSFSGSVDFGGGAVAAPSTSSFYVASWSASGAYRWATTLGSTSFAYVTSIAVDRWGEVAMTGIFMGTLTLGTASYGAKGQEDAFLAKLDAAGKLLWSQPWSAPQETHPFQVAVDSAGNVSVVGEYMGDPMTLSPSKSLAGDPSFTDGFLITTSP